MAYQLYIYIYIHDEFVFVGEEKMKTREDKRIVKLDFLFLVYFQNYPF